MLEEGEVDQREGEDEPVEGVDELRVEEVVILGQPDHEASKCLVFRLHTGPRALRILLLELDLRRVAEASVRRRRASSRGSSRRRIGGSL
eukprot:5484094-Heterocapsa_arctica.AAC.1